ncbi:LysM peptidoglycan-binding domain-containing protein [Cellulomonas marina]|uniref:LysM domain-containing protein n=1 Tax=Cellulomonas marina TaxID=988821 RepID=A0A1I0VJD3_9CELL|nr:LysM peptidoglycan-binding domain-containing protein [Cellulomonas marina]GIG27929.1 peptidoglycan-binding protein LysM [Cellulomonas marina]SFA76431.1 LysM domain-containing protein [Cellulomonas marina]
MRSSSTARPAAAAVPLRLTARGRWAALLVVAGVAATGLWSADRAEAGRPAGGTEVARHLVAPGDTLWEIAEGVVRPGEDVRDVVLELVQLNRLPSSQLSAGQTIVVPVRG